MELGIQFKIKLRRSQIKKEKKEKKEKEKKEKG